MTKVSKVTPACIRSPASQYYVCTADADNILSNYPLNTSKGKHSHATKFAVQCNVVCQPRIFLTWPSMANRRSSRQLEPNSSRQIATQSKHPLAPHNVHSKTLGGFFLPLRDVSHQKLARLGKKMVIYGHSLPPPLSREDQSNRLYLISVQDENNGRRRRTTEQTRHVAPNMAERRKKANTRVKSAPVTPCFSCQAQTRKKYVARLDLIRRLRDSRSHWFR